MSNYILADNQELTNFALQSLIKQDKQNVVYVVGNKAELNQQLKVHENAIVILDYTLFDFSDEEQLLVESERFKMAQWILLCDDLTPKILRKITYSSHTFSVLFKDCALSELREAIQLVAQGKRYISQKAMEIILSQLHEVEQPEVLTATEIENDNPHFTQKSVYLQPRKEKCYEIDRFCKTL